LFRIAQEALRNALRHGGGGAVEIRLEGDRSVLELTVTDHGKGFLNPPTGGGLGLRIMRHRAELIGGRLEIESMYGKGTRVYCHVPVHVALLESQSA